MHNHPKPPAKGYVVIIRDVVIFAAALLIFAYFHHVRPTTGKSLGSTLKAQATAEPMIEESVIEPEGSFLPEDVAGAPETTPAPSPTPEPRIGDFSAVFPQSSTGEGALHSYQSDNLRIAITKHQEDGITYFVADVWVRDISYYRTAFAKGQFGTGLTQYPTDIADEAGAVFAVSGDYYGARKKGVVVRNGELFRDSLFGDVCVLYQNGVMETFKKDDFDLNAAIDMGVVQAWSFGPALLDNGKAITGFTDSIKGKNPRCAMGYYEPGHYCFVLVDGRQSGYSSGMTFDELSALFEQLGCVSAYNLDGGATAVMVFGGEVVNHPTKGGRKVSDIICFGEVN